jgi:phosphoribosylaminoimidazole-succinocarboxamide synthase
MNCLVNFATPQLQKIHSGKVRDSIRIDDQTRMIAVTDRLSAFDSVLKTPIPHKGAVLNGIANFWFEHTRDLIESHFIKMIDSNITLVKEAEPIRVEMVIRGYLTGSMWRGYQQGKREFSGVQVQDGLTKNQCFPQPIVTPTTKEKNDREITPEDLVKEDWVTKDLYAHMEQVALKLFERGTQVLAEKGIILVDTKYEFGLLDGRLILIDEIHTPDSSRFWRAADYDQNPKHAEQIDKEFVRQWLLNNKVDGHYSSTLPDDVVRETSRRYCEIYEMVTGNPLHISTEPMKARMTRNLVKEGLIKDGYVAIIMGSPSDLEHCQKIQSYLEKYDVYTEFRVVSAHKNGEEIGGMAQEYNNSIEPGVVIAVAGRSNGLGGALSANLNLPVINCPPFKDNLDMLVNVNSSLMMPSKTPAVTVIHPDNAAYAALRSLNLYRLRDAVSRDIETMKTSLKNADSEIRSKK